MTTSTPAPTASDFFAAQKFDGTGSVHVVTGGRLGSIVTFCTGRSMSWMAGVDVPVTCKACIKKATANGMDLSELAPPRRSAGPPPATWPG